MATQTWDYQGERLDLWAAFIAGYYAQILGWKYDSSWIAPMARYLEREVQAISGDAVNQANVRAFVEAKFALQLGVPLRP